MAQPLAFQIFHWQQHLQNPPAKGDNDTVSEVAVKFNSPVVCLEEFDHKIAQAIVLFVFFHDCIGRKTEGRGRLMRVQMVIRTAGNLLCHQ